MLSLRTSAYRSILSIGTCALLLSACDDADDAAIDSFGDASDLDDSDEEGDAPPDLGNDEDGVDLVLGNDDLSGSALVQPPLASLTQSELSQLLLGGNYTVTNPYAPNGVHAGIDFGGTGDGVTTVRSPVNGTVIANTTACGKVAIFDGTNTIILAHMSNLTAPAVGASVSIGASLGKASKVVGGGCTATGAHLHIEIRTGQNTSMAAPANNNTNTTRDPLTYGYSAFPAVSLLSPSANAAVNINPVSFSWSAIQGANTYRLQISQTNAFTSETCTNGCVYNTAASTSSRSVALNAGTYYWRVRAGNSGQGGLWSTVRSVTRL
ncbi:M23 family metallopeptidase [Enhygromyxa salina]|nr:M23 family metallopeptidase [Enhygromyxa salina]